MVSTDSKQLQQKKISSLDFSCPSCGAKPRQQCMTANKKCRAHLSRRSLARDQRVIARGQSPLRSAKDQWRGEYSAYLNSAEWKIKRYQAAERDGFVCRVPGCCSTEALEGHHVKYPRGDVAWGSEPLSWIVTLCRDHHQELHRLKTRTTKPRISMIEATRVILKNPTFQVEGPPANIGVAVTVTDPAPVAKKRRKQKPTRAQRNRKLEKKTAVSSSVADDLARYQALFGQRRRCAS